MSPESDYSYTDPSLSDPAYPGGISTNPLHSLAMPFALLSTALAIVMLTQTIGVFRQRSALQESKVQLADAIKKRAPAVTEAGNLQNKLQAMVLDLLLLGKTDDDAKAIIQKYNIQQNTPAGTTPAPTPTP